MEKPANEYYQSHGKLSFIGPEGQSLIDNSSVLVIGAGGLGCPCLQYLAGCGIKIIGIADFDTVAISNLHRQILFTTADIGLSKTHTAIKKLNQQNPGITLVEHNRFVCQENILSLLKSYDVIVDATDNFEVRYLINDACVLLNKPLVYGAIHQTEGHLTVFNYYHSPTLRCLFPQSKNNTAIPSCAAIGAYNITTGIIGLMMANEVIKIILLNENVLASELFCMDIITGKTKKIHFKKLAQSREQSISRFRTENISLEISPAILWEKINNKEVLQLIDVREEEERVKYNIGGENIPLHKLLNNPEVINLTNTIIMYCEYGSRSLSAVTTLHEQGVKNIYSLQGGIHYFLRQYPGYISQ
ncbi:MAG: HesA/MoeB/ThiF family protein [Ferruginibacter sp.]